MKLVAHNIPDVQGIAKLFVGTTLRSPLAILDTLHLHSNAAHAPYAVMREYVGNAVDQLIRLTYIAYIPMHLLPEAHLLFVGMQFTRLTSDDKAGCYLIEGPLYAWRTVASNQGPLRHIAGIVEDDLRVITGSSPIK